MGVGSVPSRNRQHQDPLRNHGRNYRGAEHHERPKKEDLLLTWIKQSHIKKALQFDEKVNPALVADVISKGYAPDLKDTDLEVIGRDPFIVAYARAKPDRCVVSVETSAPSKQRQNRKLPDVCQTFGIACYQPYEVNRTLGFKTNWKKP